MRDLIFKLFSPQTISHHLCIQRGSVLPKNDMMTQKRGGYPRKMMRSIMNIPLKVFFFLIYQCFFLSIGKIKRERFHNMDVLISKIPGKSSMDCRHKCVITYWRTFKDMANHHYHSCCIYHYHYFCNYYYQ